MSEAIFSKYSKGGDVKIDNNTKIALGVNNNATLDDCLMAIGKGSGMNMIDPYTVPFTATVLHPNSGRAASSPVQVRFPNKGTATYYTNASGMVTFNSPAGGVWINDANCDYFDLTPSNRYVTCSIGQNWNNITLLRQKTFTNGGSYTFTYNTTIRLSEFINRYDVECRGGDGSGASGDAFFTLDCFNYGNNCGNSPDRIYTQSIGYFTGCINGNKSYYYIGNMNCNRGANGFYGNINIKRNIQTTGSISITIGRHGFETSSFSNNLSIFIKTWAEFNTLGATSMRQPGKSGATTSYGSICSAIGGAGGPAIEERNTNGYSGPLGRNNIPVEVHCANINKINNSYTLWVNRTYAIPIEGMNNGYVKLTNIYYK